MSKISQTLIITSKAIEIALTSKKTPDAQKKEKLPPPVPDKPAKTPPKKKPT